MIQDLRQDILIEWNGYDSEQQKAILEEFRRKFSENYTKTRFFEFLKDKPEIERVLGKINSVWPGDTLQHNVGIPNRNHTTCHPKA